MQFPYSADTEQAERLVLLCDRVFRVENFINGNFSPVSDGQKYHFIGPYFIREGLIQLEATYHNIAILLNTCAWRDGRRFLFFLMYILFVVNYL